MRGVGQQVGCCMTATASCRRTCDGREHKQKESWASNKRNSDPNKIKRFLKHVVSKVTDDISRLTMFV